MKELVDRMAGPSVHGRRLGKLFQGCLFDPLHASKVLEKGSLPDRADSRDFFQNGFLHRPAPELLVMGDGKAMGFVPDSVEKKEEGGMFSKNERLLPLRMKDLLFRLHPSKGGSTFDISLLGEAQQIDIRDPKFSKDLLGYVKLSFASVEEDEIGKIPLLESFSITAKENLVHHPIIVDLIDRFDLEMAISVFFGLPVHKGDHGPHGVTPLDVGDVEGLDPMGGFPEMKLLLQRLEELLPVRFRFARGQKKGTRVFLGHGHEILFFASFGNKKLNPSAFQLRELLFEEVRLRNVVREEDFVRNELTATVVLMKKG